MEYKVCQRGKYDLITNCMDALVNRTMWLSSPLMRSDITCGDDDPGSCDFLGHHIETFLTGGETRT